MGSLDSEEANGQSELQRSAAEGRIKLLSASFAVVCVCVFTIIQYNLAIGPQKLPAQIVRLILTLLLCGAVYVGSRAAHWICVVLFSIGVAMLSKILLTMNNVPLLFYISISANLLTYIYFLYLLLLSKDVKTFLESKRS